MMPLRALIVFAAALLGLVHETRLANAQESTGSWRNLCSPLATNASSGSASGSFCDEATMPPARYRHAAESLDDVVYFYGGIRTTALSLPYDVETLTTPVHEYVVGMQRTWVGARGECARSGGDLASIASAAEDELVRRLVPELDGNTGVWIGGNDQDTPGTYAWSDGTLFEYTNWNASQPSIPTAAGDGCVELVPSTGAWRVGSCLEDLKGFVCKLPNPAAVEYDGCWRGCYAAETIAVELCNSTSTGDPCREEAAAVRDGCLEACEHLTPSICTERCQTIHTKDLDQCILQNNSDLSDCSQRIPCKEEAAVALARCNVNADAKLGTCITPCVSSQVLDDLWALLPDAASPKGEVKWQQLCAECDPRPPPRYASMSATIAEPQSDGGGDHHLLFIYGGAASSTFVWDDLWVIRLMANGTVVTPWRQLCTHVECRSWAPRPRSGGALVPFGRNSRKLWLFGGEGTEPRRPLSGVYEFDMDLGEDGLWREVCATVLPDQCLEEKAVVGLCDGNIARWTYDAETKRCESFLYSNCEGNGNNFASNASCMSQCGAVPHCCAVDGCPDARSDFAYALAGSDSPRLYIVGGMSTILPPVATVHADAWYLDLMSEQWRKVDALPEVAVRRHSSSLVALEDGRLVLFGGSAYDASEVNETLDDLWVFDTTTSGGGSGWSPVGGCTAGGQQEEEDECVARALGPAGLIGQTMVLWPTHGSGSGDNSSSSGALTGVATSASNSTGPDGGGSGSGSGSSLLVYGAAALEAGVRFARSDVMWEFSVAPKVAPTPTPQAPAVVQPTSNPDAQTDNEDALLAHFFVGLASLNRRVLPALGAVAAALLVFSSASHFHHRKGGDAYPLCLLLVALTFADVITDVLVVSQLWATRNEFNGTFETAVRFQYIPGSALIMISILFFANGAYTINTFVRSLRHSEEFQSWIRRHAVFAGVVALASCATLDSLRLLSSKLFALEMFDAPFSAQTGRRLRLLGIIGIVLEDVPQLVMQSIIMARGPESSNYNLSLLPSILITCASLCVRVYLLTRLSPCRVFSQFADAKLKEERVLPVTGSQDSEPSDDSDSRQSVLTPTLTGPLTNPEVGAESDSDTDSEFDDLAKKSPVGNKDAAEGKSSKSAEVTSSGLFDANSKVSSAKPKHRKEVNRRRHSSSRSDSHSQDGSDSHEAAANADSLSETLSTSDSELATGRPEGEHSDSESDVSDRVSDEENARAGSNAKAKFECKECGVRFTMKCNMNTHIRNKHRNREKKHKCGVCGSRFHRRYNLKQHMLSHDSVPNASVLQCDLCNKSFPQKGNYMRHIHDVHDKPGKCSVRGCGVRVGSEREHAIHCEQAHPGAPAPVKMVLRGKRALQCYCKARFGTLDAKVTHFAQCAVYQDTRRNIETLRNASGIPADYGKGTTAAVASPEKPSVVISAYVLPPPVTSEASAAGGFRPMDIPADYSEDAPATGGFRPMGVPADYSEDAPATGGFRPMGIPADYSKDVPATGGFRPICIPADYSKDAPATGGVRPMSMVSLKPEPHDDSSAVAPSFAENSLSLRGASPIGVDGDHRSLTAAADPSHFSSATRLDSRIVDSNASVGYVPKSEQHISPSSSPSPDIPFPTQVEQHVTIPSLAAEGRYNGALVSPEATLDPGNRMDTSPGMSQVELSTFSTARQQIPSLKAEGRITGALVRANDRHAASSSPVQSVGVSSVAEGTVGVTPLPEGTANHSQPGASADLHDSSVISLAKLQLLQKLERLLPTNDEHGFSAAVDDMMRIYKEKQASQNSEPDLRGLPTRLHARGVATHHGVTTESIAMSRSSSSSVSSSRDRSKSPFLLEQSSQSSNFSPEYSVFSSLHQKPSHSHNPPPSVPHISEPPTVSSSRKSVFEIERENVSPLPSAVMSLSSAAVHNIAVDIPTLKSSAFELPSHSSRHDVQIVSASSRPPGGNAIDFPHLGRDSSLLQSSTRMYSSSHSPLPPSPINSLTSQQGVVAAASPPFREGDAAASPLFREGDAVASPLSSGGDAAASPLFREGDAAASLAVRGASGRAGATYVASTMPARMNTLNVEHSSVEMKTDALHMADACEDTAMAGAPPRLHDDVNAFDRTRSTQRRDSFSNNSPSHLHNLSLSNSNSHFDIPNTAGIPNGSNVAAPIPMPTSVAAPMSISMPSVPSLSSHPSGSRHRKQRSFSKTSNSRSRRSHSNSHSPISSRSESRRSSTAHLHLPETRLVLAMDEESVRSPFTENALEDLYFV